MENTLRWQHVFLLWLNVYSMILQVSQCSYSFETIGNNVTLRSRQSSSGALKSWVDTNIVLPKGFIQAVELFRHSDNELVTPLLLQVWYKVPNQLSTYTLLWEHRVVVPKQKGQHKLRFPESPLIPSGAVLGWTYLGNLDPISFDYKLDYPLYFRDVDVNALPAVGQMYKFSSFRYPAKHSIAVEMQIFDPCVPNPCQNNGSCGVSGNCECSQSYSGLFCEVLVTSTVPALSTSAILTTTSVPTTTWMLAELTSAYELITSATTSPETTNVSAITRIGPPSGSQTNINASFNFTIILTDQGNDTHRINSTQLENESFNSSVPHDPSLEEVHLVNDSSQQSGNVKEISGIDLNINSKNASMEENGNSTGENSSSGIERPWTNTTFLESQGDLNDSDVVSSTTIDFTTEFYSKESGTNGVSINNSRSLNSSDGLTTSGHREGLTSSEGTTTDRTTSTQSNGEASEFDITTSHQSTMWSEGTKVREQITTTSVRYDTHSLDTSEPTSDDLVHTTDSSTKPFERITYDCQRKNPCKRQVNLDRRYLYWTYDDPHFFVQCSMWAQCFIMPCPIGMLWDACEYTCNKPEDAKC